MTTTTIAATPLVLASTNCETGKTVKVTFYGADAETNAITYMVGRGNTHAFGFWEAWTGEQVTFALFPRVERFLDPDPDCVHGLSLWLCYADWDHYGPDYC